MLAVLLYLPMKVSRESRMQEGMPLDGYSGRAAEGLEGVAQCVRAACSVAGDAVFHSTILVLRTFRQVLTERGSTRVRVLVRRDLRMLASRCKGSPVA